MKNIGLLIMIACLSSIITIGVFKLFENPEKIVIREPVQSYRTSLEGGLFSGEKQRTFLSSAPTDFSLAAGEAVPAVVFIRTLHANKKGYWKYNYTASSGSGVLVSPNGYIVTNHHVIENGSEIRITLNDKREFEANLVGSDPNTDLALIKIEAENLEYVEFGNSDSVQIGEWVLAIGNPFRLESTVTAGIVSAKARSISIIDSEASVESFIQTDAVVNQGNSGGALVNTNGELIGINAAIITQSGKYEGYSFAIPSNLAQKVIDDLREFGEVRRGLLGVVIKGINSDLAKKLKLDEVKGVYIDFVNPSSAAKKAGLEEGDVIVSINKVETNTLPELQELVARFRPGDAIQVSFIRKSKNLEANVVLQENMITPIHPLLLELGFELRDLTDTERSNYKKAGARVNSIYKDSKIVDTNMDVDFIITSVNGNEVSSVEEVVNIIKRSSRKLIELGGFYPQFEGEFFYSFKK